MSRSPHVDIFSNYGAVVSWTLCIWFQDFFLKSGDSCVAVQQQFHKCFIPCPRGRIPTCNIIMLSVSNFRATGSTLKRKLTGLSKSARMPENIYKRSCESQFSTAGLQKSAVLHISNHSVKRVFWDLHFYPYKIAIMQVLYRVT